MTNRTSYCADCGQGFPVETSVGPMPARCATCAPVYRRAAVATRSARRKWRQATGIQRIIRCVDCKIELAWDGRSRPKLRCEQCVKVHNNKVQRCAYAVRVAVDPEMARERWRQGYRKNAERIREQKLDQHYRRRYGLTRAQVDELSAARGGLCDNCHKPPDGRCKGGRLHVDHCHKTGRFRGLLCGNCNTMIGLAGEDPKVLLAAVEYLARNQPVVVAAVDVATSELEARRE
jgi:hypothetical protein